MANKNPLNSLVDEARKEILKGGVGAKKFVDERKEEVDAQRWLRKARMHENAKQFDKALNAYLKFMELKLSIIESRPNTTLKSYFSLAPYYLKIAKCYESIGHLTQKDRVEDLKHLAENYLKAARIYNEVREYRKAHKNYELAAGRYEEAGEYKKAGDIYMELGGMYEGIKNYLIATSMYAKGAGLYERGGEYKSALEVYMKSAEMNKRIKNISGMSSSYEKAAELYRGQGEHKKAVKYYLLSAMLDSRMERVPRLIKTYDTIARDYEDRREYETAIYYYLSSAEFARNSDRISASNDYESIGRCYASMKDYKRAIRYYEKAANIRLKLKRYRDAASAYRVLGECHEELGEFREAGDSYFSYAEISLKGDNDSEGISGYRLAAESYIKAAERKLKEKRVEEAVELYKRAGASYVDLKDPLSAARIYYNAAGIEAMIDYSKAVSIYKEAARLYENAEEVVKAADSYWMCKDYRSAMNLYLRYAKEQESQENYFHSGGGYIKVAKCNIKLGNKTAVSKNYTQAIRQYLSYLDKIKSMDMKKSEEKNPGLAHFWIGESYRRLDELQKSESYFEKAVLYFRDNQMATEEVLSITFLSLTKAERAVQQGDYQVANKELSKGMEYLNEAIEKSKGNDEYTKLLSDTKKKMREMLSRIGEKPEITLLLDRQSSTFVGEAFIMNMVLTNRGKNPVRDIIFLPHIPEELRVVVMPADIDEIKPGESSRNSIELVSDRAGSYHIKPLEVLYHDRAGNRYVKSSNPITIDVIEKVRENYKNYRVAISTYLEYAKNQFGNGNYFHAGEGYRRIGEIQERFGEDVEMEKSYRKAVNSYLRYVEGMKEKKNPGFTHLKRMSEAYKNIGEMYERINNLQDAEKYFRVALESYRMIRDKTKRYSEKLLIDSHMMAIEAFISKVAAKSHINHGKYPEAKEYLKRSKKGLEDALRKGGWSEEEERFIEKNKGEIKVLMDELQRKPAVSVSINLPKKAKANEPLVVKISVKNEWSDDVHDIRFLTRLPDDFEVKKAPGEIPVIRAGEEKDIRVELIPRSAGKFQFQFFDMTYKDGKGRNYMTGSEDVLVEIAK